MIYLQQQNVKEVLKKIEAKYKPYSFINFTIPYMNVDELLTGKELAHIDLSFKTDSFSVLEQSVTEIQADLQVDGICVMVLDLGLTDGLMKIRIEGD